MIKEKNIKKNIKENTKATYETIKEYFSLQNIEKLGKMLLKAPNNFELTDREENILSTNWLKIHKGLLEQNKNNISKYPFIKKNIYYLDIKNEEELIELLKNKNHYNDLLYIKLLLTSQLKNIEKNTEIKIGRILLLWVKLDLLLPKEGSKEIIKEYTKINHFLMHSLNDLGITPKYIEKIGTQYLMNIIKKYEEKEKEIEYLGKCSQSSLPKWIKGYSKYVLTNIYTKKEYKTTEEFLEKVKNKVNKEICILWLLDTFEDLAADFYKKENWNILTLKKRLDPRHKVLKTKLEEWEADEIEKNV